MKSISSMFAFAFALSSLLSGMAKAEPYTWIDEGVSLTFESFQKGLGGDDDKTFYQLEGRGLKGHYKGVDLTGHDIEVVWSNNFSADIPEEERAIVTSYSASYIDSDGNHVMAAIDVICDATGTSAVFAVVMEDAVIDDGVFDTELGPACTMEGVSGRNMLDDPDNGAMGNIQGVMKLDYLIQII